MFELQCAWLLLFCIASFTLFILNTVREQRVFRTVTAVSGVGSAEFRETVSHCSKTFSLLTRRGFVCWLLCIHCLWTVRENGFRTSASQSLANSRHRQRRVSASAWRRGAVVESRAEDTEEKANAKQQCRLLDHQVKATEDFRLS